MMKCPKCNKSDEVVTRPDGTKYCLDCGERIASDPSDATACSPGFCLHGFTFETSAERQKAATSHPLWKKYMEWDRRRHCGIPDMDDAHDREVFEAYIEGAFQQSQENVKDQPTNPAE